MIKQNQHLFNRLNVLSDGILIAFSMLLAYLLRFQVMQGVLGENLLIDYIRTALLVAPFILILYGGFGLYGSFRARQFTEELSKIILANFIGTCSVLVVLYLVKAVHFSRLLLLFFFLLSTLLVGGKRLFLRSALRRLREQGLNLKHVIVLGAGKTAESYLQAIRTRSAMGYHPVGYLAAEPAPGLGAEWLGEFDRLEEVLTRYNPDEVVAALEAKEYDFLKPIIAVCEKTGCKLSIIPFYAEYMPSKPDYDEVDGIPLLNLRHIPLDNLFYAFLKRSMDLVGALILLIVTSPLMLFAAVGTKLSSPGPVIFQQERVGRNKKPFIMYKFRSMRVNADSNVAWSTDQDPRKTKFGALLRKCSIDELPQLINVLMGTMSLVGPRPELPHFVDQFKETVPLYMVKHQVRPGITGWAQVNGYRGDTSVPKRVEYDIYYIEHWSIFFDLKILLMTLFGGILNRETLE